MKERKSNGDHIDSKNIKKHKNDVFRLTQLITTDTKQIISTEIANDMRKFLSEIENENIDLKSIGIKGSKKASIIDLLYNCYNLKK